MHAHDPRDLEPVATALDELERCDAARRLRDRDASLFSGDPSVQAAIADRLGWLDVVTPQPGWTDQLRDLVAGVRAAGLRRVVLAGMGGSSLAPEVFARVFRGTDGLELEILDSTHPDAVTAVLDDTDLTGTLVVVASKSGTTEETRAFGAHAARLVPDASHLMAITDPGSALAEQAVADGWRAVLSNPADIGGRFSALSLFGMAPAALAGVDIAAVWQAAGAMNRRTSGAGELREDPAAVLGAFMGGLARTGRDKLTVVAADELAALGDWIEQLVAESTGKDGVGVVPVAGEPVGEPGAYGDDRAFVELRLAGVPVDGASAMADAGHPVLTLDLPDRAALGAAYLQWELATSYAAVLLGVNPFDEPNVTESKEATKAVLALAAETGTLPAGGTDDVAALLAGVGDGDYVSFQVYLPVSRDHQAVLARARTLVRDRLRVATTVGFGPRFLHSTGQLHKGGPDSVVALQVTDAPHGGPGIPGRPYDFATLVRAQAAGDLATLRNHGRRVAAVTVDAAQLGSVSTAIERALAER
jgi:glucose-6-phosphate isomerase